MTIPSHAQCPTRIHPYQLPYDSVRDFAPVARVASSPLIVVVHPSVPAKSVIDFIAIAKAKPGELFYPVSGVGNISHLAGELFNLLTGVNLVSVPYKGSGPGLNDLLGGRLFVGFNSALSTMPHIKSGRLRAIAVTSSSRARPKSADCCGVRCPRLRGDYLVRRACARRNPAARRATTE